jgi:hypothetical protein
MSYKICIFPFRGLFRGVYNKLITVAIFFIPKAMLGWERRMWNALTEREVLSALEHLKIEIKIHSNSRCCVTSFLIY